MSVFSSSVLNDRQRKALLLLLLTETFLHYRLTKSKRQRERCSPIQKHRQDKLIFFLWGFFLVNFFLLGRKTTSMFFRWHADKIGSPKDWKHVALGQHQKQDFRLEKYLGQRVNETPPIQDAAHKVSVMSSCNYFLFLLCSPPVAWPTILQSVACQCCSC